MPAKRLDLSRLRAGLSQSAHAATAPALAELRARAPRPRPCLAPVARSARGGVTIHNAEALAWLRTQPDASFDALLSDPPYGLAANGRARTWDDIAALRDSRKRTGFLGRAWDAAVPGPTFWREALRVLKPGAPLLVFGGTRTYHRLVCALEDAGAEILDCLAWMYAQGFPKSYDLALALDEAVGFEGELLRVDRRMNEPSGVVNVGQGARTLAERHVRRPSSPEARAWEGYGTALRPSWEPCVLACKPFEGTIIQNARRHGVGGLWIDACRIDRDKTPAPTKRGASTPWQTTADATNLGGDDTKGGWPANVILDEAAAELLDEVAGVRPSGARAAGVRKGLGYHGAQGDGGPAITPSTGGASRFFFVAKVSRWEREFGCRNLPQRAPDEAVGREEGSAGCASHAARGVGGVGAVGGVHNHHPTAKPIALAQWLAAFILPPPRAGNVPRRLLVPFAGSGSEAIGAMRAGWDEIAAVEMTAEYIPILEARVAQWAEVPANLTPTQVRELYHRGVKSA